MEQDEIDRLGRLIAQSAHPTEPQGETPRTVEFRRNLMDALGDSPKSRESQWYIYACDQERALSECRRELAEANRSIDELNEVLRQAGWGQGEIDSAYEMLHKAESRVAPRESEEGPVGWIQEHKDGRLSFYAGNIDPRDIHDNGMPTYPVYRSGRT